MIKNECAFRRYLRAIEECPNELVDLNLGQTGKQPRQVSKLTADFGISNQWPINLRTGMEEMTSYLTRCQRYIPIDAEHLKGQGGSLFVFPGEKPIGVHITPWIYDEYLIGGGKEKERVKSVYSTGILLLTDGSLEGEGALEVCRRLADVVGNLSRWIFVQNIPTLLPRTRGWKYEQEPEDPKSMIAYKPRRPNNSLGDMIFRANPWLPTAKELSKTLLSN